MKTRFLPCCTFLQKIQRLGQSASVSRFALCCVAGVALAGFSFPTMALAQDRESRQESDLESEFNELTRSFEKFAETLERKVEGSMEDYGKEIEAWSERYGKEMEKWAEQHAGEWEAWAEKHAGEFEKWAEKNAGQLEEMARHLERRFAELEMKLRSESQQSPARDGSKTNAPGLAVQIRQELAKTDPNNKEKIAHLKQKLFEALKSQEMDRDHSANGDKATRNVYLERRIDEIRTALKTELPKEKRVVLEKALAELNDLRAATHENEDRVVERRNVAQPRIARNGQAWNQEMHATQDRLKQMMVAEEQRHEQVMNKLRQESQRLVEQANRMQTEARHAEARAKEAEAKAREANNRERSEVEKLQQEVMRLKKELDSLRK